MNEDTKKVTAAAVIMVAILVVIMSFRYLGPSNPPAETTHNVADSKKVVDTINHASKIEAKKDWKLFGGDTWTIYADDKKVGIVQGLAFHVSGDVYALSSPDGNLVGAETENPQMFSNKATIYDWNSKEIGHLQTEFGSLMTKIDIYRGSNQVGKSEQQFGISLNTDIKNTDGSVAWHMDKAMFSFGADLTITRKSTGDNADSESSVSGMEALWTSLAMNEIHEARANNSGRNHK